ncbi:unnamed protein product [Blepharisma stoltei]|uniref:Kelch motif family protein n=1 Tax=Blepharisma stoltei TaxID=1481888 RepID=A0AAU9J7K6_9CILI|nr:unnamed protein product [Blepharisma stoltei]
MSFTKIDLERKLKEASGFKEKMQNEFSENSRCSTWTRRKWQELEKRKIIYQNELQKIRNLSINDCELEALINENTEIKAKYDNFNEKINEISNDLELFIQEISFESRFLYRSERNPYGSQILVIDIVKHQRTVKIVNSEPLIDEGTTIVNLPNYELFCYSNWRHKPWGISGASLIVDLISFTIKKILPPGLPIRYSGGVYWNNSIYIFGGYDGSKIKSIAKRFDLVQNRWYHICDLPKESDYTSCIVFNRKILISGLSHTDIYEYDEVIDEYSEIHVKALKWRKERQLILGNSRAYIIQFPWSIFESRVNDQYHWRYIGEIKIQPYIFNQEKVHKNAIFVNFKTSKCSYFLKFDFFNKTIEEIKISDLTFILNKK